MLVNSKKKYFYSRIIKFILKIISGLSSKSYETRLNGKVLATESGYQLQAIKKRDTLQRSNSAPVIVIVIAGDGSQGLLSVLVVQTGMCSCSQLNHPRLQL